jgi:hypothetical protein
MILAASDGQLQIDYASARELHKNLLDFEVDSQFFRRS